MFKKIILISLLILSLSAAPVYGVGQTQEEISQNLFPNEAKIETRTLDKRAQILADYFAKYNSPLQNHAQDFVDAADKYGLDWKLVPSISGVESTFGKQSYGYNAWGWGIYGNQTLNFNSWEHGIDTVTGGLKQNYVDKGLTNPYSMNKVYAASPSWGWKVTYFMNDLEKFAQTYGIIQTTTLVSEIKIAGDSAKPALQYQ